MYIRHSRFSRPILIECFHNRASDKFIRARVARMPATSIVNRKITRNKYIRSPLVLSRYVNVAIGISRRYDDGSNEDARSTFNFASYETRAGIFPDLSEKHTPRRFCRFPRHRRRYLLPTISRPLKISLDGRSLRVIRLSVILRAISPLRTSLV